jgi:hypothetical protein
MKKKSLTVIRNAGVVGNNSKSYNDKHPENPVSLRPLHDALLVANVRWLRVKLRAMKNWSRPDIAHGIAMHIGG